MTDPYTPTSTYPHVDPVGTTHDDVYPVAGTTPGLLRNPGKAAHKNDDIKPEQPRRHPVAYLALVLSVISLLWLAIWSSSSGTDGYQKVRVGTQDCVSVPQDTGPAALYCRTAGVPIK